MNRSRIAAAVAFAALLATPYSLKADVRADQKTRFELGGVIGKMVNFFGGKAAREGVISTTAVKGDRKATLADTTRQIIDLNEEKIYDVDVKGKSYKVTTFAELRQHMEEARRNAEENARRQQQQQNQKTKEAPGKEAPSKNEKEVDFDFDLKETGQKKTINGFDTHEVIMTITVREKGKTLEQSGGMVLTSDMWTAPSVAAMKEIRDFDLRYMRKLQGSMMAGASPEDMAAAVAMYPMLKDALARMHSENVKLDGTPILTTVTMDAVKSAEEAAQEPRQTEDDSKPSGVGGLFGNLAKKAMQKKSDAGEAKSGESKNRATFMTLTSEVLKVTTDVSASDVEVPAGFRQNK